LKTLTKQLLNLLLLLIIIFVTGFLLTRFIDIGLGFTDIIAVSGGYTLITVLIFMIFFRGLNKPPDSQTMHSMVAIVIKFLMELVFAFTWFFLAKKTGLSSVLLFFVLYLTFTLFSVIIILKALKDKSLLT